MAVFLKAREGFLGGDIDWNSNKFKAILVDMNDAGPTPSSWMVTAVTNTTNPTITTSAAHGLSVGNTVEIFLVGGATGVNGVFVVASTPTSTTFTITLGTAPGVYTSGGYIANLSLTFLSQFVPAAGRVATAPSAGFPTGSQTIVDGVADAADVSFTAVPGPDAVEAILIVRAAAAPADADLADTAQRLVWLNTPVTAGGSGLPVTPNGGNIDVAWNAQGLFAI